MEIVESIITELLGVVKGGLLSRFPSFDIFITAFSKSKREIVFTALKFNSVLAFW